MELEDVFGKAQLEFLEDFPVAIALHNRERRIVWANQRCREAIHLSLREIRGKRWPSLWDEVDRDSDDPVMKALETGKTAETKVVRKNRKQGVSSSRRWLSRAVPVENDSGRSVGALEIITEFGKGDITERSRTEEILRISRGKLSNAMRIASLGSWEYDVDKDLFTFDENFFQIFRTTVEEVGSNQMSSEEYARRFVHPDDQPIVFTETMKAIKTNDPDYNRQLEHKVVLSNGETGYISVRIFIEKNEQGRTVKTYGVNQDITESVIKTQKLQKANEIITRLSYTDSLTELPNRRCFEERFKAALSAARRHGFPLALAIVDMDHFKLINDTFGHDTGDAVLKSFADILRNSCREEDLCARWGGEEFILMMQYTAAENARLVIERIRRRFEETSCPGVNRPVTASFGITENRSGDTPTDILVRADRALYRAKEEGRNKVVVGDSSSD